MNVLAFDEEAHQILAKQEDSKSRVYSLSKIRVRLAFLSLRQNALFEESIRCIEYGIFRASYVMAWAGFMDYFSSRFFLVGLDKLYNERPSLKKHLSFQEILDNVPEFQIVELAKDMKFINKREMRELLGYLSKRNECAHPNDFLGGINESLGYVSSLMSFISKQENKQWP